MTSLEDVVGAEYGPQANFLPVVVNEGAKRLERFQRANKGLTHWFTAVHKPGPDAKVKATWQNIKDIADSGPEGQASLVAHEGTFGNTLHQYFEGFQRTLFGKVVEPYGKIVQYNAPPKGQADAKRVRAAIDPRWSETQLTVLQDLLRKTGTLAEKRKKKDVSIQDVARDFRNKTNLYDVEQLYGRKITIKDLRHWMEHLFPNDMTDADKDPNASKAHMWNKFLSGLGLRFIHTDDKTKDWTEELLQMSAKDAHGMTFGKDVPTIPLPGLEDKTPSPSRSPSPSPIPVKPTISATGPPVALPGKPNPAPPEDADLGLQDLGVQAQQSGIPGGGPAGKAAKAEAIRKEKAAKFRKDAAKGKADSVFYKDHTKDIRNIRELQQRYIQFHGGKDTAERHKRQMLRLDKYRGPISGVTRTHIRSGPHFEDLALRDATDFFNDPAKWGVTGWQRPEFWPDPAGALHNLMPAKEELQGIFHEMIARAQIRKEVDDPSAMDKREMDKFADPRVNDFFARAVPTGNYRNRHRDAQKNWHKDGVWQNFVNMANTFMQVRADGSPLPGRAKLEGLAIEGQGAASFLNRTPLTNIKDFEPLRWIHDMDKVYTALRSKIGAEAAARATAGLKASRMVNARIPTTGGNVSSVGGTAAGPAPFRPARGRGGGRGGPRRRVAPPVPPRAPGGRGRGIAAAAPAHVPAVGIPAPVPVPAVVQHPLHNIVPPRQRQFILRARRAGRLEQGVRGYDPNAGMVHLVNPSFGLLHTDDHFMKDIHEDSNQGARAVQAARKGPFRNETGRSRVMSRSAHVLIRKRRKQIEITVRRAATEQELHALHAKLGMHFRTSSSCIVFLVERGQRKSLGPLGDMNLLKLMELIRQRLMAQRGTIGILLVDDHHGGAMHNPRIHRGRFTRGHYKGDSINHIGDKNDKYIQ